MARQAGISSSKSHILKVLGSPEVIRSDRSMSRSTAIIVPYDPSEEDEANELVDVLVADLRAQGHTVAVANLYDIVLDILDEDDLYEEKVELERTHGKARLKSELKDAADVELDILPAIEDIIKDRHPRLLFLTGVGACYPFLRTHQLLDILDENVTVPVVVFYPGTYRRRADGSVPLDILGLPQSQGGGPFYQGRNVFDM